MVLGRGRLQSVDKRLGVGLGLVDEQQQVLLAVAAKDPLGRLLRELHDQRQTVLRHELAKTVVRYGVVFQLRPARVKLHILTRHVHVSRCK